MTTTTFLLILGAIIVAYIIMRIVGPIIRLIIWIIAVIIILLMLQRFFGFDLVKVFGPYGKYLDPSKWNINLGWVVNLITGYINQAVSFFQYLLGNVPKS